MNEKKFNPKNLNKLNNPARLKDLPPDYIWNKVNLSNPETIIDIGAGTGFFSIAFLSYAPNARIYACDIADPMIEWTKKNVSPEYPNIVPLKMEENNVPLKDATADLVYMINLHHELDEPEKMLAESYRLLKKGGKIFIADWKKKKMDQGPPVEIRCLQEDIIKQLAEAGFNNTSQYNTMEKHFLLVAEK